MTNQKKSNHVILVSMKFNLKLIGHGFYNSFYTNVFLIKFIKMLNTIFHANFKQSIFAHARNTINS